MTIDSDYSDIVVTMKSEISVSEFKATCLEILREIQKTGRSIRITKRGQPVAELRPASATAARSPVGVMRGRGRILGDIVSPIGAAEDWEAVGD